MESTKKRFLFNLFLSTRSCITMWTWHIIDGKNVMMKWKLEMIILKWKNVKKINKKSTLIQFSFLLLAKENGNMAVDMHSLWPCGLVRTNEQALLHDLGLVTKDTGPRNPRPWTKEQAAPKSVSRKRLWVPYYLIIILLISFYFLLQSSSTNHYCGNLDQIVIHKSPCTRYMWMGEEVFSFC